MVFIYISQCIYECKKKKLHKANSQATTTDGSQKTLSPLDCVGGFIVINIFYIFAVSKQNNIYRRNSHINNGGNIWVKGIQLIRGASRRRVGFYRRN